MTIEALDSITIVLMYVIGMCVFVQKTTPRLLAAAAFAGLIIAHDTAFHALSDDPFWYYLTGGITDLTAMAALSNLKRVPRLAIDLQMIAGISLVYNVMGWLMFMRGYDTSAYVAMYVVLYAWAVVVLLMEEPRDDKHGDFSMDSWISFFRVNAHHSRALNRRH